MPDQFQSATLDRRGSRDRLILVGLVILTTAGAWAYMIHEAQAMRRTGICECMGMAMAGPDLHHWSAEQWLALFLMWSEMMVAMMLPSAAPMILTFSSVNRTRRERQAPFVPVGIFVAGYLVVWIIFSLAATLLQWALHAAALLSPAMASASPWLAAALLIAAGLFQFTPWKAACLTRCANPLGLLLTGWREGRRGAFVMGVQQGLFCVGCCWALMLLLFVLGVMNVTWIAVLTIYVLVEKLLGKNPWLGRVAGGALCAWGGWVLAKAFQ